MTIAIVDYGLGNLANVRRAIAAAGFESVVTSDAADVESARGVVLPGVGAFGAGMANLTEGGFLPVLARVVERGTPLLGICLGMQLLMEESEEFGRCKGLGLLPGRVVRFDPPTAEARFKIPQIGWNRISRPVGIEWTGSILEGLEDGAYAYFVHSFYVRPAVASDCLATAEYGRNRFCAVIGRGSVMGCQFHLEKSGRMGLHLLRNFGRLVAKTP